MSTALAESLHEEQVRKRHERRPCDRPGRGITLGQLLARVHEAAVTGLAADCPVCGGELRSSQFASECNDCGSRLA